MNSFALLSVASRARVVSLATTRTALMLTPTPLLSRLSLLRVSGRDRRARVFRGTRDIHISPVHYHDIVPSEKSRRRFLPTLGLYNKVCVVTGGARGLGNTLAEAFLEAGCSRLAIMDLSEGQADAAATSLVQKFEASGTAELGEIKTLAYGLDVSDESSVAKAMNAVMTRWGRIDCLVAAAGIAENIPALDYPADRIKRLYDINVHGSYFCAREAAKRMIDTGTKGSITLVASMSGKIVNVPQPQAPYNASKAAVRHMAGSLAVEWAQHGIRVNSLSPGYMRTPLVASVLRSAQGLEDAWTDRTPMKRLGLPEDLKGAIVLLASDASSFMTGADIVVDGGYTVV